MTDYEYRTAAQLTSAVAVANQIDLAMSCLNSASVAIARLGLAPDNHDPDTPLGLLLSAFCDANKVRERMNALALEQAA